MMFLGEETGLAAGDQMNQNAQPELIIRNGSLWAGPDHYWPRGQVETFGGKVTYAGPERGAAAAAVLDAGGGLILPGLVNAHCHSPMVLFRGLADDLPLEAWLNEHIFPAEAKWVSEEMTEASTLLAAAEMLLSGTTCVGDSYFCMNGAARALERSGMRALAMHGVIDFPAPGVPDPARNVDIATEFAKAWLDRCPRITPALFAHSVYTCSPATLRAVAERAAGLGRDLADPPGRESGRDGHGQGALPDHAGPAAGRSGLAGSAHRGGARRVAGPGRA